MEPTRFQWVAFANCASGMRHPYLRMIPPCDRDGEGAWNLRSASGAPPLTPGLIILGRTIPTLIVALIEASVILAAGVVVSRIPFQGLLPLLYISIVYYILAVAGIGLLISSICSTQQQAFLGVFSFVMPAVMLPGFPSPVENMPQWLQWIDWFNPLRHFIVIVKGLFIKNISYQVLFQSVWLLVIETLTFSAAIWMFRKRIG